MAITFRYLDQFESHPDHWLRRTVHGGWDEARQAVADFVGADVEDVVFVTNATTGLYLAFYSRSTFTVITIM